MCGITDLTQKEKKEGVFAVHLVKRYVRGSICTSIDIKCGQSNSTSAEYSQEANKDAKP